MKNIKLFTGTLIAGLMLPSLLMAQNLVMRPHAKERVLVKFKNGLPDETILKKVSFHNSKIERKIKGPNILLIKLPPGLDEEKAAKKFKEDQDVEFAEVDSLIAPSEIIPSDPYFNNQWGLKKIGAPIAWESTVGRSAGVTIAILDTGVDSTHPDLATSMLPGWNIVSNNTDSSPITGHGTAVAGVAAAIGDNAVGVTGVCWDCNILPIRVTDSPDGYAYFSNIASAITYAANRGARVVNASYASWSSSSVTSAAQYLKTKGGVYTTSAGNDAVVYSSPSNSPDMLVVGATDTNDNLFSWTARGAIISVTAPGNVYTTAKGGGYGSWNGTSFSAPMTAGLAAIIISVNPNLTSDQVMNIIKSSADDLGALGYDTNYGHGRINAARAIAMAGLPQPQNGSCGSSQGKTFNTTPTTNLCAAGNASSVILATNTYTWTCSGLNGGTNASCSAFYQAPDTTAPTAPMNLKGAIVLVKSNGGKKAVTVPNANLSWSASSDNVGVISYTILRNNSPIATVSSLSYVDKNISKGVSYTYAVIANDAAGNKSPASLGVTLMSN